MNSSLSLRSKLTHLAVRLSAVASLGVAVAPWAAQGQTEPAEKAQAQVTRNAQSPLLLTESLSKNVFRDEVRQVPYTVQVPYQTTETYTEQVPYEETETYTEQVPYTRSVPYQDTETYYDREYRCQNVTHMQRECRNERTCVPVPDTHQECHMEHICRDDHRGGQTCVDHNVCRSVGTTRQECRDNPVCRDVPVTDRRCEWENVPRTRTVTRYRDVTEYRSETRTRTVTKYRSETRTRTVTKYRDEQRCCKPETFKVFDHQVGTHVSVTFPPESQLVDKETETVKITLGTDPAGSDAAVTVESTIFKYDVADKKVSQGAVQFTLRIVPRFTADQLGKGTVTQLKVLPTADRLSQKIVFVDTGLKPRVDTKYALTVKELASGQVVHQAQAATTGEAKIEFTLPAVLQAKVDYLLQLDVQRAGVNLAQPVQFSEEAKHLYRRLTVDDVGEKTVSKLAVSEDKGNILVRFTDLGTLANVESAYSLDVTDVKTGQPVHRAQFKAQDVTGASNAVTLAFPKSVLNATHDHKIAVRVLRTGDALVKQVVFVKEAKMAALKRDIASFRDESKVALVMIKGQGASAQLQLRDQTDMNAGVDTSYEITLKVADGSTLGQIMLERNVFQKSDSSPVMIGLRMLASEADLNRFAVAGETINVTVRVLRTGAQVGRIEFTKTAALTVTP